MSKTIRIFGLVQDSIVDGPGLRYVIFTQGCTHQCEDCHNKESWNLAGGDKVDIEDIVSQFSQNPLLSGITLSGGEPLCQIKPCLTIATKAKEIGLTVTMFSGYTLKEILKMSRSDKDLLELINKVDILIDGPYDKEKRDLKLNFRGSFNQNIIDMNKTRQLGRLVLMEEYM